MNTKTISKKPAAAVNVAARTAFPKIPVDHELAAAMSLCTALLIEYSEGKFDEVLFKRRVAGAVAKVRLHGFGM
jgi:hypothetical protein